VLFKGDPMMYNNKLAIAVKSNGKVLRERGDTVYVPFGTEYTLLIKNLNSVRALVDVSIDGTDAGGGTSFVIPANGEVELERFITNGNMNKGNRFKFIERTSKIEEHRGAGISDGLIRISYQFEKVQPVYVPPYYTSWKLGDPQYYIRSRGMDNSPQWMSSSDTYYGAASAQSDGGQLMNTAVSASTTGAVAKGMSNDVGITVPGSLSDQKFTSVSAFETEKEEFVMVVQLLGETETGHQVTQPVTVKTKAKCATCGHLNKATSKFCSECATSLQIV
jgi:hypothetical protein